jgi:hypothetical protein
MSALADKHEAEWGIHLKLFSDYRHLAERIVNRPSSYASSRPQDYVVSLLTLRSFRLAVGVIVLSQHGYSDLAIDSARSIWEIGIRLADMIKQPVPAAFGYLLGGVSEEITFMQEELRHRTASGMDAGNLQANITVMTEYRTSLEARAKALGYDPAIILKRYGRLNFRQVCTDLGLEKAYLVSYKFSSTCTHGFAASVDQFIREHDGIRELDFGPAADHAFASVLDALKNLIVVIGFAAEIVEDDAILCDADRLRQDLAGIMDSVEREARAS